GQEDLAGEAVAQDPEDLVADVGLQAVDGQDHAALLAQEGMQSLAVDRGQGAQLIVAFQEVADRAEGDSNAAARQFLVDLGDAAMLGVTEASDQGQDVQAELVMGQSDEGLCFGAAGTAVPRAVGVGAAANAQSEARDSVEGGD